nr:ribonuclease H-like domain-containing protein [Tanacetum cinerariifolium]
MAKTISCRSYNGERSQVKSEGEDEVGSPSKIERKSFEPSMDKVEVDITKQNDKPARRPVKYAVMYRTQRPRGNQRNWNNLKSHQLGNISYFTDFKEFNGWYIAFGGGAKGGKITGKGIIKTGKLDFEDVYFFKELKFNLFSVSQMCDKKKNVLFTDTKCFVLSPDFKLADESHILLKVPRKNNMYSVDMKNIVPKKDLTCLVAKATNDESMLWHRRLGHINFKNINKLVKENIVRATKDETSRILKNFITEIENLVDKKVKIISRDNGTEFKNRVMNEFCEEKDSKLPTTCWAEAVNTACYVQNRILVVKPHFKTPYELFRGTNSNDFARKGASFDTGQSSMEIGTCQDYILMPLWNDGLLFDSSPKYSDGDNKDNDGPCKESEINNQKRPNAKNSTRDVNTARPSINTGYFKY